MSNFCILCLCLWRPGFRWSQMVDQKQSDRLVRKSGHHKDLSETEWRQFFEISRIFSDHPNHEIQIVGIDTLQAGSCKGRHNLLQQTHGVWHARLQRTWQCQSIMEIIVDVMVPFHVGNNLFVRAVLAGLWARVGWPKRRGAHPFPLQSGSKILCHVKFCIPIYIAYRLMYTHVHLFDVENPGNKLHLVNPFGDSAWFPRPARLWWDPRGCCVEESFPGGS